MEAKVSCKFCASRCGMLIKYKGNRLDRVSGNLSHPVSRGWSCGRGRAATTKYYKDKLD